MRHKIRTKKLPTMWFKRKTNWPLRNLLLVTMITIISLHNRNLPDSCFCFARSPQSIDSAASNEQIVSSSFSNSDFSLLTSDHQQQQKQGKYCEHKNHDFALTSCRQIAFSGFAFCEIYDISVVCCCCYWSQLEAI